MISRTGAHFTGLLALASLAFLSSVSPAGPADPTLQLVSGSTAAGDATEQWLAMLRKRLSPAEYDSVARIRKHRTPEEQAWATLIQSRIQSWEREIPPLAAPFQPTAPPNRVLIVLGNRGGGDAFTHDPSTIGFDLAELTANYGVATQPENPALMDRLFRHEFTHLLQKAWLPAHPWLADSPLRAALLDIWLEGLGNYYSLSDRWRRQDGQPSDVAQRTLASLEPRFVTRLSALTCADSGKAGAVLAGISSGPFDHKWGAVPVALWLQEERGVSSAALRNFIEAGPAGVWELADHHLPEPLRLALEEARVTDSLCTTAHRLP
jgi:hypothetical protein